MKLTTSFTVSLLASVAAARPRAMEEGDPLPQKSRITAFVVDEKGNPSVECWEINNLADSQQRVQRTDGSKAFAHSLQLAGHSDLDGLDILTWPSVSPIWPIPDDSIHSEWFDLAQHNSLFSIQGGLINFNLNFRFGSKADDEDEQGTHIFSLENGDDWFYFEDNYSGSDLAKSKASKPYPFTISTISGTETELLRLRYSNQPKHKVVHKGACRFTGIKIPDDTSARTSRVHSPLTVQVNVEEL